MATAHDFIRTGTLRMQVVRIASHGVEIEHRARICGDHIEVGDHFHGSHVSLHSTAHLLSTSLVVVHTDVALGRCVPHTIIPVPVELGENVSSEDRGQNAQQ